MVEMAEEVSESVEREGVGRRGRASSLVCDFWMRVRARLGLWLGLGLRLRLGLGLG